jgi:hypothetical protein
MGFDRHKTSCLGRGVDGKGRQAGRAISAVAADAGTRGPRTARAAFIQPSEALQSRGERACPPMPTIRRLEARSESGGRSRLALDCKAMRPRRPRSREGSPRAPFDDRVCVGASVSEPVEPHRTRCRYNSEIGQSEALARRSAALPRSGAAAAASRVDEGSRQPSR